MILAERRQDSWAESQRAPALMRQQWACRVKLMAVWQRGGSHDPSLRWGESPTLPSSTALSVHFIAVIIVFLLRRILEIDFDSEHFLRVQLRSNFTCRFRSSSRNRCGVLFYFKMTLQNHSVQTRRRSFGNKIGDVEMATNGRGGTGGWGLVFAHCSKAASSSPVVMVMSSGCSNVSVFLFVCFCCCYCYCRCCCFWKCKTQLCFENKQTKQKQPH